MRMSFTRAFIVVLLVGAQAMAAEIGEGLGGLHNPGQRDIQRITAMLADKERGITWVFIGGSITQGARHTLGSRSYPEHFAERVRWEMSRYQDVVINTGVTNDTTDGALRQLESRILRFKPDVVSIMYGLNDCVAGEAGRETFHGNLVELISRVREAGAIPLLHTPNPIQPKGASWAKRSDLPAYLEIIREVAAAEQAAFVDHFLHWRQLKPEANDLAPWFNDALHPNAFGHRELANETFRVLGVFSADSPTCRLPLE